MGEQSGPQTMYTDQGKMKDKSQAEQRPTMETSESSSSNEGENFFVVTRQSERTRISQYVDNPVTRLSKDIRQ